MNVIGNKLKIAVAPVAYYWSAHELYEFYARVAQSSADIIYLGETICSKRRALRSEEWLILAHTLRDLGKEVVLSTLTLIEAESEMHATKRLIDNGEFTVECNDMAAVHYAIEKNIPFIAGPAINIYNSASLDFLISRGLLRWIPSVEQSNENIENTIKNLSALVQTEIFAYGYLPLAYSARCFSARQYQYPKDHCQFVCQNHPEGIILNTQEEQSIFRINGIQTQSAQPCNLLASLSDISAIGAHSIRLSFSNIDEVEIIERMGHSHNQTIPTVSTEGVNGFWWGQVGMQAID